MIKKNYIREKIFNLRNAFSLTYINKLNRLLYLNFLKNDFLLYFKNETIAGYIPFKKECNIFNILKYYSKNNTIVIPKILEKNKSMVFKEWNCDKNNLKRSKIFKKICIHEPLNACVNKTPSIVLVPAVAVDIYGNRVGYGQGYYDRTLAGIEYLKIGVVFDFQIFNECLENENNDIKLDYILSESVFLKI